MEIYAFHTNKTHIISFKNCTSLQISFAEIEVEREEDCQQMSRLLDAYKFFGKNVTYEEKYYMRNIMGRNKEI